MKKTYLILLILVVFVGVTGFVVSVNRINCPSEKIYTKDTQKNLPNYIIDGDNVCYGIVGGDSTESDYLPYVEYKVLNGKDGNSFKVLYEGNLYTNDGYTLDKNGVYYANELISGADPKNFTLLPEKALYGNISYKYGKDSVAVYYLRNKVIGADPATFEVLGYSFAKDSKKVFFRGKEFIGVDPNTFVILDIPVSGNYLCDYVYVKDKNKVYLYDQLITGADPASFTFLGDVYAKDKNNVFIGTKISNLTAKDVGSGCSERGVW